jgi:hypothetical protein
MAPYVSLTGNNTGMQVGHNTGQIAVNFFDKTYNERVSGLFNLPEKLRTACLTPGINIARSNI